MQVRTLPLLILILLSHFETLHAAKSCLDFFSAPESNATLPNPLSPAISYGISSKASYPFSEKDIFYKSGVTVTTDGVEAKSTVKKTITASEFKLENWPILSLRRESDNEQFYIVDSGELNLLGDRRRDDYLLGNIYEANNNIEVSYSGDRLKVEMAIGIMRTSIYSKIAEVYKDRKKSLNGQYVDRLSDISGRLARYSSVFAAFSSSANGQGLVPQKIKENLIAAVQYHPQVQQNVGFGRQVFKTPLIVQLPMFYGLETRENQILVENKILEISKGKPVAEFSRAIRVPTQNPKDADLFDAILLRAFETAEKDGVGTVLILTDDKTEKIFRQLLNFETALDVTAFGVRKHLMYLEINSNPESPYQQAIQKLKAQTIALKSKVDSAAAIFGLK